LNKDNLIPVNKFVVEISALSKITLLIDYFDKYPLLGLKAKSYIYWKEVYVLILAKKYLTTEGFLKIQEIHKIINKY
jgi:hypothetical protein